MQILLYNNNYYIINKIKWKLMEEYEEVEENPKNEKIIQENDENIKEKNILDINKIIKERNKYNNISYEENNINNGKYYNIKEKLK